MCVFPLPRLATIATDRRIDKCTHTYVHTSTHVRDDGLEAAGLDDPLEVLVVGAEVAQGKDRVLGWVWA